MEIGYFNGFMNRIGSAQTAVLCLKEPGLNLTSLLKAVQSSKTRGHLNFHLKNSKEPKQISA